MRAVVLPVLLVSLLAGPAWADAFYVCTKKGESQQWVNEAGVASAKRRGYRCKKRMEFGSGTTTSKPKTRYRRPASSSGSATDGGRSDSPAPTSVRPTRRFAGPAGEAQTFEPWIQEASDRYNVPANLVRAVIRVESNFRPQAVSGAGAQGLMQLMPGTAKDMGVSDSFDPRQNIFGGTRYLRVLINKFAGDAKLAIAAYHAGPGIVAARGEIPYKQTRKYVKAVLKHYLKYRDGRL